MDRERLKQVLRGLRDRYREEWNESKDDVFRKLEDFAEIMLSRDKLSLEDIEQLEKIWDEIPINFRRLFNIFFPFDESERIRMYNDETIRKLMQIAKKTNNENFEENLEKIAELMRNVTIRNVGVATLSSFVAVANPDMFMPTTEMSISSNLRDYIGIDRFIGSQSNVQKYEEFMKTVKEVANEIGINSMLEVAFYLSKYSSGDNMEERIQQILESVEISDEDFESVKKTIHDVKNEILDRIDELREKGWENGWDILNKLHRVPYFNFVNLPQAFKKHKELSKILADFVSELKNAKNLDDIRKLLENTASKLKNIQHMSTTQLLHLAHVIRSDLFIPVTQWQISNAIRFIYDSSENLHGASLDRILDIFNIINELRDLIKKIPILSQLPRDERLIKFSLILYKYGERIISSNRFNRFLEIISRKFLERCAEVSENQLGGVTNYYRLLYLPSDFDETVRRYIHLEWLFRGEKLCVGIHIEVTGDPNKNDRILNTILRDHQSKFEEIARDVGGELEILRDLRVYRWIHISKPYSELNEDLEEWAVKAMTKLYNEIVPIIRERQAEIKRIINENKIDTTLKNKIDQILNSKKQVILYGPPGTGKTWTAQNYVMGETNNKKFYEFVTFHPSYSYEEFVEGLKPIPAEATTSGLKFIVEDGIFKRIAIRAICEALKSAKNDLKNIAEELLNSLKEIENGNINEYDRYLKKKRELWNRIKELSKEDINGLFENAPKFYLVIDEINRGDISRIFGELITLLEADKRLGEDNQIIVTLPYSKEPFGVPPNLFIIGTMNTADRSIALIDIALRRRFGFIELMPSYKVLINELGIGNVNNEGEAISRIESWEINELSEENPDDVKKLVVKVLYSINEKIKRVYDRDHQIGHSYLLKLKNSENIVKTLEYIWYHEIIPLLQEYFYDSPEKLSEVLNGNFVKEEKIGDKIIYEFVEERDFINALKGVVKEEES